MIFVLSLCWWSSWMHFISSYQNDLSVWVLVDYEEPLWEEGKDLFSPLPVVKTTVWFQLKKPLNGKNCFVQETSYLRKGLSLIGELQAEAASLPKMPPYLWISCTEQGLDSTAYRGLSSYNPATYMQSWKLSSTHPQMQHFSIEWKLFNWQAKWNVDDWCTTDGDGCESAHKVK